MRGLIFFLMFFAISNAFADCNEKSCTSKLSAMVVRADGDILVRPIGDISKLNCRAVSDRYLTLSAESKQFEAIYASLLTLYTLNKSVTIRIKTSSDNCEISYITL